MTTTGPRPTGRRVDVAALRHDVRAAWADATAALVVTLLVYWLLVTRLDRGTSMTLDVMPYLSDPVYWMYWMCQAFGWSALLWAWGTVMLGLLRSSRPPSWLPVRPAAVERLHRTTSLTTMVLMLAHAVLFFGDQVRQNRTEMTTGGAVGRAFVDAFVPGGYASGTGVVAVLLGLLALYLAVPLGLAYYVRRWIGPRVWQALHASILVVYVLSVWHTLLYGTNVWFDGWFRTTVWLLQLPVAALLLVRLLAPARRPGRSVVDVAGRCVARAAAAATVVLLLVVAATGRDGGRTPGVDGAPLGVTQAVVWTGLAVFVVVVAATVVRAHRDAARP